MQLLVSCLNFRGGVFLKIANSKVNVKFDLDKSSTRAPKLKNLPLFMLSLYTLVLWLTYFTNYLYMYLLQKD